MGMDVYGKNPTTEEGKYFRNNVWWWRPLADYCIQTAPEVAGKCRYWHTNDADGLDADDSIKMADALDKELESGRTDRFARVRASDLERKPKITCSICAGTGTRKPVPTVGAGDPKADGIPCNGCGGSGHTEDYATYYGFDVDNVRKFVAFLRGCGGFEIC
jgi:hypothetical protein